MGKKLIINNGSRSKKYALYGEGQVICDAHFEHLADAYHATISTPLAGDQAVPLTEHGFANALESLLAILAEKKLVQAHEIEIVGIRVVAPGEYFTKHLPITDEYLEQLHAMQPSAPLHIDPVLNEIRQVRELLPHASLIGISDSAFHAHIPAHARQYGISNEDAKQFGVYRFGYHGLSVGSVFRKLPELSGGAVFNRAIICHLGGGASVSAIRDGVTIDTTMGFSPVSGLVMSTRSGDIDAGALLYLADQKGMDGSAMREYLNTASGFKGLAGEPDMRELLARRAQGDELATLAITMFMYRIKKYIGAYHAVLGGTEVIALTGTMAERNHHIRAEVCAGLEHFGVVIDQAKNDTLGEKEGYINVDGTKGVVVVHTDEMGEMARCLESVQQH